MAKLTAAQRKKIPKSEYVLPNAKPKPKYPVNDRRHAINAKARATQMRKKGKISKSTEEKIDAKANRKLGKSAKKK